MKFVLGKYINKDLTKNIYLRVIVNRQIKDFPIVVQINAEHFNEIDQLITIPKDKKFSSELNMILTEAKGKANDVFVHFKLLNAEINMDTFTEHFNNPQMKFAI